MHLKFSQDIQALLARQAEQPISLADILAETAERGFVIVIGLLVLPFLFPMPPGLSTILGSACLLLSLQMLWGRHLPWLPRRVARFRFPQSLAKQLLTQIERLIRLLERFVKPRWLQLATHPQINRLNGFCLAWLTLLLMAPIPFTNPIPAVGMLLFVVAILEADGLLMCFNYGLTGAITGFFGLIFYGLWRSPAWFNNWLNFN
jgi:hypothetical protein